MKIIIFFLIKRYGRVLGTKGTIVLKRIAPCNTSELGSSILAAILAPFGNPTAIVWFKSNL